MMGCQECDYEWHLMQGGIHTCRHWMVFESSVTHLGDVALQMCSILALCLDFVS